MKSMRGTSRLQEAKPTEGYAVHVRFEDGTEAEIDLSYLLDCGGVFAPLRDLEFFRRLEVYPERQTIFWPGEVDVAPETLYAHAGCNATTAA